jgi:hypothetical protein
MWKNVAFLLALLIASRFIGLPTNFSPLLALAVFMPRLTDDKRIQHLLPVSIIAFTNLFLEPVNALILVTMLLVFAITPTVSRFSKSLFLGSLSAVLTWFVVVNGAVWFAGGGSLPQTYIAAIPFDFRLAVSTGLYVALFHSAEKICVSLSRSNIKLLDRLV